MRKPEHSSVTYVESHPTTDETISAWIITLKEIEGFICFPVQL